MSRVVASRFRDFDINQISFSAARAKVVDFSNSYYDVNQAVVVLNGKILGQLPAKSGGEHFGMVLQKGSPLTVCVNQALARLKANGTLKTIQATWLSKVVGAPVLR